MGVNFAIGWLWIHLGVVSGMALGTGFLRPGFLGGYDAARRRLVRLGHISFFGLGGLNVLFAHASPFAATDSQIAVIAATGLIVAAISMPLACAVVAWRQAWFPLFAVPVIAAICSTALIAWEAVK
jgi:hypothetical protein